MHGIPNPRDWCSRYDRYIAQEFFRTFYANQVDGFVIGPIFQSFQALDYSYLVMDSPGSQITGGEVESVSGIVEELHSGDWDVTCRPRNRSSVPAQFLRG